MSILSFFQNNQKVPKWTEEFEPEHIDFNQYDAEDILDEILGNEDDEKEQPFDHPLIGASFGIEYVNAKGEHSDRWVSVNGIGEKDKVPVYMQTYCFVAERPRSFRFDRIKSVYDDNGVVEDTKEFFEIFDLTINDYTPPKETSGYNLKKMTRDQVKVLISLARIDGEFHESEIDEILTYAVKLVENRGYIQTNKDINAFRKYLRNLYPTGPVIDTCLGRINKYTDRGKRDFIHMCNKVMNADFVQHEAEFDLILNIRDRIEI